MSISTFSLKKRGELKCIRLQHFMMAEATARNREAVMKMNIDECDFDGVPMAAFLENFMRSLEEKHRQIAAAIEEVLNVV